LYQKIEHPVLARPVVTKEPPAEAEDVLRRVVEAGRANISSLLSYAKRRRITVVV